MRPSVVTTLWILVILFAAGDVATTVYGIDNGFTEANPLIEQNTTLQTIGVMVVTKIAAILISAATTYIGIVPNTLPPAVLATIWGVVTLWNICLLLL